MTRTCDLSSKAHGRPLLLVGLMMLAAALPGAISLAWQADNPVRMPTLALLQFGTYDSGWLRYRNVDENGERKLELEGLTQFPFRYVVSKMPNHLVRLKALDRYKTIDSLLVILPDYKKLIAKLFDGHETVAEFIDDLIDELTAIHEEIAEDELVDAIIAELIDRLIAKLINEHKLAYDEDLIAGYCDTEELREISEDVFCIPGVHDMPQGFIFLALYHPETFEIVALTSYIYNRDGAARALVGSRQLAFQAAPGEMTAEGCGPYGAGQWIKATDYAASGLNLPVVQDELVSQITDYQCIVPADDAAPYLRAYTIPPPPPQQRRSLNSGGTRASQQRSCNCQSNYEGKPLLAGRIVQGLVSRYCDCCYGDGSVGYVYVIGA